MLELTHALRSLGRTPATTLTAVLTLAFGVGVTTAVFLVVNAAILQPLPYERPEQLVELVHDIEFNGAPSSTPATAWPEVHFWRGQTTLFSGVEAFEIVSPPLRWRARDKALPRGRFTSGLPHLLGLAPIVGRVFTREEANNEAPVVMISEALWDREFDRALDVVGSTLNLNDTTFTVIGVLPAAFRYGPAGGGRSDTWTGLPERGTSAEPAFNATMVVCRLHEGLSLDQANAMAVTLAPPAAEGLAPLIFRDSPVWSPRLWTLDDWRARIAERVTMSPLLALLSTGGFLLLIACANVANLLIARGLTRRDELQTRAALGASRARLMRLVFVEGAILTAGASIVGVVVAQGAVQVAMVMMPAQLSLRLFEVSTPGVDWRVGGFVVLASVCTALLASLAPAIGLSRAALTSFGRDRITSGILRGRVGHLLQSVQVALALVLTIGAGLMVRVALPTDLGFDIERLGEVEVILSTSVSRDSSAQSQRAVVETIRGAVRGVSGVEAAAIGRASVRRSSTRFFEVEGQPAVRNIPIALRSGVTPDYFDVVGMRVTAGRGFRTDDLAGPPVVIVDEAAARVMFGDGVAVGRRVRLRADDPWNTVVGVVNDAATTGLTRDGSKGIYTPWSQDVSRNLSMVIRTPYDVDLVLNQVTDAIEGTGLDVEVARSESVAAAFERRQPLEEPRFVATLLAVFALLALLTAAVGLFSVLSYSVRRRQREFGVRIALGASVPAVRELVVGQALATVVPGVLLGWGAALLVMRSVRSQLYGVATDDPVTYGVAGGVILIAGLLATVGPIRRAVRTNPIEALRAD